MLEKIGERFIFRFDDQIKLMPYKGIDFTIDNVNTNFPLVGSYENVKFLFDQTYDNTSHEVNG